MTNGYVLDTSYTDRFFRELSPVWLNYVAALNGHPPRPITRPFTYLELGCGFGHSVTVNAGAFPHAAFHACDINAGHIDAARSRAAELEIPNVTFHQKSFEELLHADLPRFDFITLHGVYSWVDADARRAVREVIDSLLEPGGLVYVSYNCWPGWAVEVPLRRLLVELTATGQGSTGQRAEQALEPLAELSNSKLRFFTAHPAAAAAVQSYVNGPGNYLVHEFLNEAWEPFYSVDVADEMAAIGLTLVGSATLADNHDPLAVHDAAAEAVRRLDSPRQRQLAMDFAANRRFRRDVFIRAPRARDDAAAGSRAAQAIIGVAGNPERIEAQVTVPRGTIGFRGEFVDDLRALMARGATTIGEAVVALSAGRRDPVEITRNLIFMVAGGALMPFATAGPQRSRATHRRPANRTVAQVLAFAVEHRATRAIPSQVLGNGVVVNPLEALAISEWLRGVDGAEALAARLESEIARLELYATDEGVTLTTADDVSATARRVAADVLEDRLPGLIRLGLIE
ncbi:MAG TPA: class I SAM-dependent methyltransferase [Thermoanaerobaculia bacterium]